MKYSEVAAKWWANKLRKVGPSSFNNGDDSVGGAIAMLAATKTALDSPVSDDSINAFESNLTKLIEDEIKSRKLLTLDVDYAPCTVLGYAAQQAGISLYRFPWKTTMWIDENEVTVSAGYCGPTETIFPTEPQKKED